MEIISSIFTAIFVALVLFTAFTFGFALLIWFVILAAVIASIFMLKRFWYRWQFTKGDKPLDDIQQPRNNNPIDHNAIDTETTIIEVDYEDMPPK